MQTRAESQIRLQVHICIRMLFHSLNSWMSNDTDGNAKRYVFHDQSYMQIIFFLNRRITTSNVSGYRYCYRLQTDVARTKRNCKTKNKHERNTFFQAKRFIVTYVYVARVNFANEICEQPSEDSACSEISKLTLIEVWTFGPEEYVLRIRAIVPINILRSILCYTHMRLRTPVLIAKRRPLLLDVIYYYGLGKFRDS